MPRKPAEQIKQITIREMPMSVVAAIKARLKELGIPNPSIQDAVVYGCTQFAESLSRS